MIIVVVAIRKRKRHPGLFSFRIATQTKIKTTINFQEWIRTIREAPKGHSMSPSWTSKSRPRVIGVGALPLQNEADVSSYPSGRISERISCEESAIFFRKYCTYPPY